YFRQPVYIGFTGPVVAPLDGIIEKPEGAVPVILIVLGGIDPPLRRDAMRPAWRILKTKCLYLIAHLPHRSRGRSPSQPRSDDDDLDAAFVGRVYQLHVTFVFFPFLIKRAFGDI